MAQVTLLGTLLAKPGLTYIVGRPGPECEPCAFKALCHNLPVGHRYRVARVREVTHPCAVHEGPVRVIEVEPARFETTFVGRGAVAGSTAQFQEKGCGRPDCPSWAVCHPPGLPPGLRVRLLEDRDAPACPAGLTLRRFVVTAEGP